MAEPASGVITLITFSLVVIRETKKFIQETRDVPNDLQRRIDRLENFEKYMEVIEKHCKQGPGCGEELLQYINISLSKQKPQLDQLQKILHDLASRGSDTLFQKVKMQIRKKLSEKELNDAMDELIFHQHFTTLFMGVGLFQIATNNHRRTSEVSPRSQVPSNDWLSPISTEYPRSRTFSNDSTVCESPSGIERSPSSPSMATRSPVQSRKSSVSEIPQSSNAGKLSPLIKSRSIGFEEHCCSSDIHYQINQAPDDHSRLCAVRQILEDPLADKSLIETKDEYGRTPLCAATRIGDVALSRRFLDMEHWPHPANSKLPRK
ncbi:hypothetical protein GRF29_8g624611 [Pseudopithomyces chartarum]|uniref:Ankyrin repeat protein n=1 Tax=Pseudopithomyces chartarum TaxID=1892770 RepID=A0AAN6M3E2_9PLEO|nr:hypothetical protein GRF29_8g624611 [Pseudopithomyces chartarum]